MAWPLWITRSRSHGSQATRSPWATGSSTCERTGTTIALARSLTIYSLRGLTTSPITSRTITAAMCLRVLGAGRP